MPASSRRLLDAVASGREASAACHALVDESNYVDLPAVGRISVAVRYAGCCGEVTTQQLCEAADYRSFRQLVVWRYCPRCIREGERTAAFAEFEEIDSDSDIE